MLHGAPSLPKDATQDAPEGVHLLPCVQCNAMQRNATQCNAMQRNATPPAAGALLVHSYTLQLHLYSINCRHLVSTGWRGCIRVGVCISQPAPNCQLSQSTLPVTHMPRRLLSPPLLLQIHTSGLPPCAPPPTAACCWLPARAAWSRCAGCTPCRWVAVGGKRTPPAGSQPQSGICAACACLHPDALFCNVHAALLLFCR